MIDISSTLKLKAEKDECSTLKALLTLLDVTIEKESEEDVHILQPKPTEQLSR